MQEQYTKDQIDFYCSLIDEIVNKTEWVIEKSTEINANNEFEIAALLSLRQIADYADGVSILIKQNSNDSAVPVIRSLFEVSIGLEYLLQENFEERSLKLLFFYYKMQEAELLKQKKGTPEYEKLIQELESDPNVAKETIDLVNVDGIDEKILLVQNTLNNPLYKEINSYYQSVKKGKKKYWYSLLDGPENLEKLVKSLDMGSRYKISYGFWSTYAHGWNIVNRNLFFEKEGVRIITKRNPTGAYLNTLETLMIVRRCLMFYVGKRMFTESKDFHAWLIELNTKLETNFFK